MLLRAALLLSVSSDAPPNAGSQRSSSRLEAQAAFCTLPARMHAVQTRTCFLTPATTARTRFRFGFHRRRRVLFAWLITFPKCGALPQNSHFSAIFLPASVFIWAWISCSNCRKTKLLILADPPPSAKCAFCIPFCIPFASCAVLRDAPLASGWFSGTTWLIARRCHPPQALFFGTGFERGPRISNPSNRIEATGFATDKEFRWPRVPLLPSFPPLNLLLSVRRRWHASRDP